MKPNNFYRQALFHALDDAVETILDAENDDTEEKWSLADKKIDHVKNLGKAILMALDVVGHAVTLQTLFSPNSPPFVIAIVFVGGVILGAVIFNL